MDTVHSQLHYLSTRTYISQLKYVLILLHAYMHILEDIHNGTVSKVADDKTSF